ncbi:MAG: hypothetical protein ACLFPA_11045 [Dichotomicrobium sp.]
MSDPNSTQTPLKDAGETDEQAREQERIRLKRQRIRSLALAWGLAALALLFFIVTIVRLGENVANRPL